MAKKIQHTKLIFIQYSKSPGECQYGRAGKCHFGHDRAPDGGRQIWPPGALSISFAPQPHSPWGGVAVWQQRRREARGLIRQLQQELIGLIQIVRVLVQHHHQL